MIVKEIAGRNRFFEFGTRTFVFIHQETGISVIDDVFERLANRRKRKDEVKEGESIFEEALIVSQIEHIEYIVKVFYACAKTGCELSDEPIDFNLAKVYSWFDHLGYEQAMALLNNLIEVYTAKNFKALTAGLKKEAA